MIKAVTRKLFGRFALMGLDLASFCVGYSVFYSLRVSSGIFRVPIVPDFWLPLLAISVFWLVVFFFFGLYRPWHAKSRLDEFISLVKAISFGCLLLFFTIFLDDSSVETRVASRFLILLYWGLIILIVGIGRMIFRSVRRKLLAAGVGLRNAIIVGWNAKAKELHDLVMKHPAL